MHTRKRLSSIHSVDRYTRSDVHCVQNLHSMTYGHEHSTRFLN